MARPPRISVRLPQDRLVIYFMTLCVQDRKPVLASKRHAQACQQALEALDQWHTFAWTIMPDHLHFLAAPKNRAASPAAFSRLLKRKWNSHLDSPVKWQEGCFDHLLRSDESTEAKWHYVRENPVRAGLAIRWEDWPYRSDFSAISYL